MQQDLKKLTVTTLLWNALDKGGTQFIYFVSGIILARILSPSDYGLVGMLVIFTAISIILFDSGLSNALIRKIDCSDKDLNTIFYFNLSVSVFLYLLLYFSAPTIASFLNQPRLVAISRIIFLSIIFSSLGIIQSTILIKNIRNREVTITNISSLLISSSAAMICAFMGFAVWSLVVQVVVQSIARTVFLWGFSNWRPAFIFSTKSLKELFPYSSKLMLSKMIGAIFQNVYSFLIGKFYNPQIVGYYSQGAKWSEVAITLIYNTIQNAIFPVFSKIQDDNERLIRAFRKTIRLMAFFVFPVLLGAILVGDSLVIILLSDKWNKSIVIFKWLCAGGIFTSFTVINMVFSQIKGRSDIVLSIEISKVVFTVLALVFTLRYGIETMAIGQAIVSGLVFILSLTLTDRIVGYDFVTQLKDMLPYFGISVIMVVLLYPIKFISENLFILLFSRIVVGGLFYFLVNKKLNSIILDDIIMVFKSKKL